MDTLREIIQRSLHTMEFGRYGYTVSSLYSVEGVSVTYSGTDHRKRTGLARREASRSFGVYGRTVVLSTRLADRAWAFLL
jgi:hypothetical protein